MTKNNKIIHNIYVEVCFTYLLPSHKLKKQLEAESEEKPQEITLIYLKELANEKAKQNLVNKDIILKIIKEKYGTNSLDSLKKSDYITMAADLNAL